MKRFSALLLACLILTVSTIGIGFASEKEFTGSARFLKAVDRTSKQWLKDDDSRAFFSVLALLDGILLDSSYKFSGESMGTSYTMRYNSTTIGCIWFNKDTTIFIIYDSVNNLILMNHLDPFSYPSLLMNKFVSDGAIENYFENDIELVAKYSKELADMISK